MKTAAVWNAYCSLVEVDRRFAVAYYLLQDDDEGSTHLRHVNLLQRDYTALHPRRCHVQS
jgi:hypothetical protein